MLQGMTVRELRKQLEGKEDDLVVVIGVDYGDHLNTTQAIPASEVGVVTVSATGYSESGYQINDEDDKGEQRALALNISAF